MERLARYDLHETSRTKRWVHHLRASSGHLCRLSSANCRQVYVHRPTSFLHWVWSAHRYHRRRHIRHIRINFLLGLCARSHSSASYEVGFRRNALWFFQRRDRCTFRHGLSNMTWHCAASLGLGNALCDRIHALCALKARQGAQEVCTLEALLNLAAFGCTCLLLASCAGMSQSEPVGGACGPSSCVCD